MAALSRPGEACRRAGVRVLIDTNNFGAVDRSSDEARFRGHLFVSQMCMLRYREWAGFACRLRTTATAFCTCRLDARQLRVRRLTRHREEMLGSTPTARWWAALVGPLI